MTSLTSERIPALDVLRGVAVGGILFANVLVFFGLFVMSPGAASLPTAAATPPYRGSGSGSASCSQSAPF